MAAVGRNLTLATVAVLAALLALAAAAAGAQGGKAVSGGQASRAARMAQAILERGPVAVRGLPFFPPNVLEAAKGQYVVEEDRVVKARIEVYFTREPLVFPAGWRRERCGAESVLRVEGEDRPTYCFVESGEDGNAFALFLSFDSEDFPWCAWTQAFLPRLRSLLSFSQGPTDAPFPAVLEYGGG
jgi:hypothetical protein